MHRASKVPFRTEDKYNYKNYIIDQIQAVIIRYKEDIEKYQTSEMQITYDKIGKKHKRR